MTPIVFNSPIEEMFYRAYDQLHGPNLARFWLGPIPPDVPQCKYWRVWEGCDFKEHLWSQFPIEKYRADFCVVRAVKGISSPRVVVECDGRNYHDRTFEQANRDRRRDRSMQLLGYRVIRFSGSELYHDPIQCARTVSDFLDRMIERRLARGST